MKEQINDLLLKMQSGENCIGETANELLVLHKNRLSLFQKNRLDLLNWAKSELKQETNTKLGKTMTPYRSDKIIFLRRVIDWINNEV